MMSLQCRCPAPVAARASFRTGRPLSARRAAVSHRAARLVTRAAADKDALLKDVQDIIAEQLGTDVSKVTPEATFADDLKADSLDTVEIMMALEEKFDLQMDEEGAEKIQTVQEVVDLIAAQVNKA